MEKKLVRVENVDWWIYINGDCVSEHYISHNIITKQSSDPISDNTLKYLINSYSLMKK